MSNANNLNGQIGFRADAGMAQALFDLSKNDPRFAMCNGKLSPVARWIIGDWIAKNAAPAPAPAKAKAPAEKSSKAPAKKK
jgi:hypothetical protein